MKRLFILFIFILLFFAIRVYAIAPGLVATPSIDPVIEDGSKKFYLNVGETVSFRIRYCGHPGGTSNQRSVSLELNPQLGSFEGSKLSGIITDLNQTDPGDGQCESTDKLYHGEELILFWKPSEEYSGKNVGLTVCDPGVCKTPLSFIIKSTGEENPPDDGDGGGTTEPPRNSLADFKSVLGDIKSIFNPKISEGWSTPEGIANRLFVNFLWIIGILSIVFLIWGGFTYIISGGDTSKADKGRKTFINAIIGLVIVIFALMIIRIVSIF